MAYGYTMGCPVCYMCTGMIAPVAKSDDGFMCSNNPEHKFKLGTDGFLKSVWPKKHKKPTIKISVCTDGLLSHCRIFSVFTYFFLLIFFILYWTKKVIPIIR